MATAADAIDAAAEDTVEAAAVTAADATAEAAAIDAVAAAAAATDQDTKPILCVEFRNIFFF